MHIAQSRRCFLAGTAAAGAAVLFGVPKSLHAEPPPETTAVRLAYSTWAGCTAAPYVAQDLLRAEGITDARYVVPDWDKDMQQDSSVWIARGETDFDFNFAPVSINAIDTGAPITLLAGLHSGCLELIAHEGLNKITDLKGKSVGVDPWHAAAQLFLTLIIDYVGLDPNNDVHWVTAKSSAEAGSGAMELFIDGRIDAFLATVPQQEILRSRKISHTILNTTLDHPWSDYYCCTIAGSSDYVSRHPVATKRVLRAFLKAADLCVSAPKWVAQQLVERGFEDKYELTVQTLADIRYDRWREFDPEDTLRFYALRMHEVGIVKSDPNKIIADGADWRFLEELKRELKT